MLRILIIAAILFSALTCLTGCADKRTVSPTRLPVYGTDPLYHTCYRGTDEHFHYFCAQHGKSYTTFKIPVSDAEIIPALMTVHQSLGPFVERVDGRRIELLVLQTDR